MSHWETRKVLVTGGAGFIGQNLALRLAELGAQVRTVDNLFRDRLGSGRQPKGIEFLKKNLLDPLECQEACQGVEVVFHMASRVGPSSYYAQRPMEVLSCNLMIDTQVIQAAVKSGVRRCFYPSSVFVYPAERQASPDAPPLREDEAAPANPPLSYGWAKVIGEKMVEYAVAENPSFRAAIGRLIGIYGPGQDIDLERGSIIPVLLRRAHEYPQGGPFFIKGTGKETRSFCYIDDAVDAIVRSVEALEDNPLIGPINIGNEGHITILDLAREVVSASGKDIEVHLEPGKTAVWGQSVDCHQARQLLGGWRPKVSLREGLQRTYEYTVARLRRQPVPSNSARRR